MELEMTPSESHGSHQQRQSVRLRMSQALNRASSGVQTNLADEVEVAIERRRTEALVEVIISYGCGCSNGNHGENVFSDLRYGLESRFESQVFVLAREESNLSCISVHVNNVLVFGCQGRQPTVEQICREVCRAMEGQRPLLIPYRQGVPCNYITCQKHKYRI